jgi:hypothetical protein
VQSVISTFFTLLQRIRRLLRRPAENLHSNTRHNFGRCLAIQGSCTYANRIASYLQMLELLPQGLPVGRPGCLTSYSDGPTRVVGH